MFVSSNASTLRVSRYILTILHLTNISGCTNINELGTTNNLDLISMFCGFSLCIYFKTARTHLVYNNWFHSKQI